MKKNLQTVLLILENAPSPIGGVERHCYNIQQFFKEDTDIKLEILSKDDISHRNIKKINKIIFSFRELKQKITASHANTVHIHGFASLVVFQAILAAIILKKRIIYTPHFHPFHTLENPKSGKVFFYLLLKPVLKKIDTIICINGEDSSFFRHYHDNVITIPNWLNDAPALSEIIDCKGSQNNQMILFVGRADNNKGIDYLDKLSDSKYEVHCVTKGQIQDNFIYHRMISEETLSKLYYQAKLVIIPSRYEAFSYVALEALSHGTQILVSDRVRILDHLPESSNMVHKFMYGDYDGFLSCINKVMNDKDDLYRSSNLSEIMSVFNKEKIKNTLRVIYG